MNAEPERWIQRYRRRLAIGLFLQRAASYLAAFLFGLGGVILLAKLVWPSLWPYVLWLTWGIIPVTVAAVWQARKFPFSRSEAVALLDQRLGTGGLLMVVSESPQNGQSPRSQWETKLPTKREVWKQTLPKVRPVRFLKFLFFPVLFALSTGLVPVRNLDQPSALAHSVAQQSVNELAEMLDKLEDAGVIEKEEASQLREEIEELQAEAEEKPLTHEKWETVDALRQRMRNRLDEAELTVNKALSATYTLKKANDGEIPEPAAEQVEQLKKDVSSALDKMLKKTGFDKKLEEAIEKLVTEEQLENLNLEELTNGEFELPLDPEAQAKLLEQMTELLDEEAMSLEELRRLAEQEWGQTQPGDATSRWRGGQNPGEPGTPGGTALTFGQETEAKQAKFREVMLPPGALDQPKDNQITKQVPTTPEVPDAVRVLRNSKRLIDPAMGRETWKRTLRPSRRDVVDGYFQQAEPPATKSGEAATP